MQVAKTLVLTSSSKEIYLISLSDEYGSGLTFPIFNIWTSLILNVWSFAGSKKRYQSFLTLAINSRPGFPWCMKTGLALGE